MIGIIRQAKNDYYEASDSVLQIGHLLGSNAVQLQSVAQTISTKELNENYDLRAYDRILQIGHLLRHNGVK